MEERERHFPINCASEKPSARQASAGQSLRPRCSILELVQTHFAAAGGEEFSRETDPKMRRSRTAGNFKFLFS